MTETVTRPAAEILRDAKAEREAAKRAEYIAGLRAIADALEADARLPLPYHGTLSEITWYVHPGGHDGDQRAAVDAFLDRVGLDATIKVDQDAKLYDFRVVGKVGGVKVELATGAEAVCEKVATRTVKQHDWAFRGQPVTL